MPKLWSLCLNLSKLPSDPCSGVRFQPDSEGISAVIEQLLPLLTAKTAVVAMGNKLQLASFCLTTFIKPMLVAGSTTEEEALAICTEHKPSFLFVSDDLEQGYAISLIKAVKATSPDTHALLFTDRESVAVTRDAIGSGANGVVFISSIGLGVDGDFLPAIQALASGGVYYPSSVRRTAGYALQQMPDLSVRETEVLHLLCLGLSNKAIAQELVLSTDTIKTYVSRVISAMEATDRLSCVVKAIRMGF